MAKQFDPNKVSIIMKGLGLSYPNGGVFVKYKLESDLDETIEKNGYIEASNVNANPKGSDNIVLAFYHAEDAIRLQEGMSAVEH